MEIKRIGTLVESGDGYRVAGNCCPTPGIPIYEVNIRPYNQHCLGCGAELVKGPFNVELFDGK